MTRVAGAVLAAGAGTRMGTPKAELVVGGVRLLDRAVAALGDGGCDPLIAVVRGGTNAAGAEIVVNPDPERGMRSSLQLAVEAAAPTAVGLCVVLVDMPGITVDAVRSVCEAWRPGRIARACYGATPAHPIVMSIELWRAAVGAAPPDGGARALLGQRPELVDDIPVSGDPTDLDTPQDVARLEQL